MGKCNNDCLNCILPQCKYDLEVFRDKPKEHPKKKKNREIVVIRKRGRPKKEREIPYWDEWYAKNKEKVKARNKARYQLKRDEILEKARVRRENNKEYYKNYHREWRRKRKEKENDDRGKSESLDRESEKLELGY